MSKIDSGLKRQVRSPRAAQVVKTLSAPVDKFMQLESAGGVALVLTAIIAMIWANSPFAEVYEHFIHTPIEFVVGPFALKGSFQHWVNDGLMAIFFYVVGLEIKRELIVGELSTSKKAALPMFAALGGMVVPALIYTLFNYNGVGVKGWGIPMATDIAFAVGILTMMSRKVPFSVKIFLLALAIVDDLGAVLVIAFFYTEKLHGQALGFAAICFALILLLRSAGVRNIWIFILLGICSWYGIFKSGIHATISGVILGFFTPLKSYYNPKDISEKLSEISKNLTNEKESADGAPIMSASTEQQLSALAYYSVGAQSPLERAIHNLHPWVTFLIMPLFALVNAGVSIKGGSFSEILSNPISLGVILGLALGKPIGVLGSCYLAIKAGIAELPKQVTWRHMTTVGILAGIGFTMALFVSHLALKTPELELFSKLGILIASGLTSVIGLTMLYFSKDVEAK